MAWGRRAIRIGLATAGMAFGLASSAAAHPHVFIESRFVLDFADALLKQVRVEWTFDEIFSAQMLADFDQNANGRFDDNENAAMAATMLPNLAEFDYFTYLRIDDRALPATPPQDFRASIANGIATIGFVLPMPEPLDLSRHKLKLIPADRSYYVEVLFATDRAVRFENLEGLECHAQQSPSPEDAYYEGYVIPDAATIWCYR